MARVRVSAAARRDLQDIADRGSADHGPVASASYMEGFRRLFGLLREQPFAGQARPELGQGLRSLSHRPYRLLYRVEEDAVVIYRILHQARDVAQALGDEA